MSADVRVMIRRPHARNAVTEMVVVRSPDIVAVLRDDDPVGNRLLRLFSLTPEELRWAMARLDAPGVRSEQYVRDVLQAFVDYKTTGGTGLPAPALAATA
jgi:hypothetical protein